MSDEYGNFVENEWEDDPYEISPQTPQSAAVDEMPPQIEAVREFATFVKEVLGEEQIVVADIEWYLEQWRNSPQVMASGVMD